MDNGTLSEGEYCLVGKHKVTGESPPELDAGELVLLVTVGVQLCLIKQVTGRFTSIPPEFLIPF